MQDRYLDIRQNIFRLYMDYKKHDNLFIASDFDNTIFDYHGIGDTYPKIEHLLKFLKLNKFKLILFTAQERQKLLSSIEYCKNRGYMPDYINTNPIMNTSKPYYNILLDDRAGLNDAYKTLIITLKLLNYDYRY